MLLEIFDPRALCKHGSSSMEKTEFQIWDWQTGLQTKTEREAWQCLMVVASRLFWTSEFQSYFSWVLVV